MKGIHPCSQIYCNALKLTKERVIFPYQCLMRNIDHFQALPLFLHGHVPASQLGKYQGKRKVNDADIFEKFTDRKRDSLISSPCH